MASVKFTKDSREFQMMSHIWKILAEFYEPDDTEEYWNLVQKILNEFVKHWDNDLLAQHLARAVILYLDEKAHLKKGVGYSGNDKC